MERRWVCGSPASLWWAGSATRCGARGPTTKPPCARSRPLPAQPRNRQFRASDRIIATSSMTPDLSIVVPIRNESPNIDELYRDITEALERWGRHYEVVV